MRKKNKKKIDPRYFWKETTLREHEGDLTSALAHIASAVICENPEIATHFGHHFKTIALYIDDPFYRDQLSVLANQGPEQDFGFARQALDHLENYFKDLGALDAEGYSQKAQSLARC